MSRPIRSNLFEGVMTNLEETPSLIKFLWLAFDALKGLDDFPDIKDQLIGEWDHAQWGAGVLITWKDPYRQEAGYLFTLPGMEGDFTDRALVHIPQTDGTAHFGPDQSIFFTLRHLACVAETIELEIPWPGI